MGFEHGLMSDLKQHQKMTGFYGNAMCTVLAGF